MTEWIHSLKQNIFLSVLIIHYMFFSAKSVNSNVQTGFDFRQLVSTCPDCKAGQKSEQKSCSVVCVGFTF